MRYARTLSVAVTIAAALAAPSAVAQDPNGPEFQVNAYTTGPQSRPSVGRDANGHFVVAWTGPSAGDTFGIMARRFNSAGVALGPEFRVNTYTTGNQDYPQVAVDGAGAFVVVWNGNGANQISSGIFGQRYDETGAPIGGEFQVNTYTTGPQYDPAVSMADTDKFIVTWSEPTLDGSNTGVYARLFDLRTGSAPPPFLVNDHTTGRQVSHSVAMAPGGAFVVTWSGEGSGDTSGVFARRFDAAGAPLGGQFLVNSVTTSAQFFSSVGTAADGSFVVAWQDYVLDGSNNGIFGRRYDAAGLPIGGQFPVNTATTGDQLQPKVAVDDKGAFIVSWWNYAAGGDGSSNSVSARQFDATGAALGPDFRVNSYTTGSQSVPAAAASPDGQFMVVWQSAQDGSGTGIFAQRYGDLIFGDSFDSGGLGMWSRAAGGGALSVSAAAAMGSPDFGLQAAVDVNDTASLYVEDDTPSDENRYRARFSFDPNDYDPGQSQGHLRTRLFIALEEAPTRRLFALVLKKQGVQYSLMGRVRRDDNSQADTGFLPIANGPHQVEVDWQRATAPGAPDGSFDMWIDGVLLPHLAGLPNGASAVDFARLGALNVKGAAVGTLLFDDFQSRRRTAIGTLP
jgi:hypothetical protein